MTGVTNKIALLVPMLLLLLGASASAQPFSNDVMTSCNHNVGQMKFDGWPADRNREMMMSACQHNGGVVPGSFANQNQQPAALRSGPRAHHQSGRGG